MAEAAEFYERAGFGVRIYSDDSDEPGHAVQGGQNEPALVAAGSHDRQGQRAPARDGQRDESDQPANGARQEPAHEPSPLSIERSVPFKASVGL